MKRRRDLGQKSEVDLDWGVVAQVRPIRHKKPENIELNEAEDEAGLVGCQSISTRPGQGD